MAKLTYKDAGVDIDAQDNALEGAKEAIRASFTPGVMGDVGLFGGLFDPQRVDAGDSILVATADGVGTKLDVARRAGVYDTVGRDLVQHCINDVLVQGAKPLFFLDYAAMGKLEPDVVSALIRGCAEACRDHGLALLGGETAEMPGLYKAGDFELVGFLLGSVKRDLLIDGSRLEAGQVLLGLGSNGLHTNGYSLARRILFDIAKYELDARPDELGGASVQEALLAPHRPYHTPLLPLIEERLITGLAHITGGGLAGNVVRILPDSIDAWIDRTSWERPPLFETLTRRGELETDEAFRAFNMGVGMVVAVEQENADSVRQRLEAAGEQTMVLGELRSGTGAVRWIS